MFPVRRITSLAVLVVAIGAEPAAGAEARYELAGGCYALRAAEGQFVAKTDGGYAARASSVAAAEPVRLQATELGRYLLFGKGGDFVAGDAGGSVASAAAPSANADWKVEGSGPFSLSLPEIGKALATDAAGRLVVVEPGAAARFAFEPAEGCATFPEVEVNATGTPARRAPAFGEVRGLLDMHMHLMGFEAYGGEYHCGRPWHRYGVTFALPDCAASEGPQGSGAAIQNFVDRGTPVFPHDTRGWPTFGYWPAWNVSAYEQTYYKWIERAWRAGLRLMVPLHNDNQVLCELMARRHTNCNEMDTVRRQNQDTRDLENYIDAQSGGPGRGWFRIVTEPGQARQVINDGKLAVVQGIETSELFDCNVYNDVPQCDARQVDERLDEMHRLGIRQMELLNKFDNAFSGVAGDGGSTGTVVNFGNFKQTGRWWDMQTCTGSDSDVEQLDTHTHMVGAALQPLLPPGTAPVYPPPPHCNARGLTPLGEHLIRAMIAKGMIIDPDHMSVLARRQALSLIRTRDYSGTVSSHSWADATSYPLVYGLGGIVTPYAGSAEGFVKQWRNLGPARNPLDYFGFGFGSDVHGLTWLGGPRSDPDPVRYPFKSFDGAVSFDRQRSGERTFDYTKDGVAHYGLYADWIEDLRKLAGDAIVEDMARGAEAYLQMWERAEGIAGPTCRTGQARFGTRGLGRIRLGLTPDALLRGAGQPQRRTRSWRYCAGGGGNVVAVFTPGGRVGLVASSGRGHTAGGTGPGVRVTHRLRAARRIGGGLLARGRFVYGVRKGRVRFVAVAAPSIRRRAAMLHRYLAIGGFR